ncbi:MAG: lipoyl synthase [Thermodesulfobacteriota bacterium]
MESLEIKDKKAYRRLPSWFKVKIHEGKHFRQIDSLVRTLNLRTVCKEAGCPNKWECWNRGTVTFIILGDLCTRGCTFCGVEQGRPKEVDWHEATKVAEAIKTLDLRYAVITSVTRDDLEDGGAALFAKVVEENKKTNPDCTIELLVPDFKGQQEAVHKVVDSAPSVLGHNLETVKRLYPRVRPQTDYNRSLNLLVQAKKRDGRVFTKSGLIIGFGETTKEIHQTMRDLKDAGCDILTIGQYLKPSRVHLPVEKFYTPEDFLELESTGKEIGFLYIKTGPLVRSSYHADDFMLSKKLI